MKIQFRKIYIEGFGSMQAKTVFNFNQQGVFVIKGKNGSGKTTIFNALVWCLYGVNLKGVTSSKIPTLKSKREGKWYGTRVCIFVKVGQESYMIARHIKYKKLTKGIEPGSSLLLFNKVDGEYQLVNKDFKGDVQTAIDSILGMSSKSFISSILFGQRMKKFIEADSKDKRVILEELLNLDFIKQGIENLKERKLDNENIQVSLRSEINSLLTESRRIIQMVQSLEKQKNRFYEDKKREIQETEKEIEDCKALIEEIKEILISNKVPENLEEIEQEIPLKEVEIDLLEQDYKKSIEDKNQAEFKMLNQEKEVERLQNQLKNISKECSACNRPFERREVTQQRRKVNTRIKSAESLLKEHTQAYEQLKEQCKAKGEEYETVSSTLTQLKEQLPSKQIITAVQGGKRLIKDNRERLAKYQVKLEKLKDKEFDSSDFEKYSKTIKKIEKIY